MKKYINANRFFFYTYSAEFIFSQNFTIETSQDFSTDIKFYSFNQFSIMDDQKLVASVFKKIYTL